MKRKIERAIRKLPHRECKPSLKLHYTKKTEDLCIYCHKPLWEATNSKEEHSVVCRNKSCSSAFQRSGATVLNSTSYNQNKEEM